MMSKKIPGDFFSSTNDHAAICVKFSFAVCYM